MPVPGFSPPVTSRSGPGCARGGNLPLDEEERPLGSLYLTNRAAPALQLWPESLRDGDRLRIAFIAPTFSGPSRDHEFDIRVLDARRRPVAAIARGPLRPAGGVIVVEWDGRDDRGERVPPGPYRLTVTKPASSFAIERTVFVES